MLHPHATNFLRHLWHAAMAGALLASAAQAADLVPPRRIITTDGPTGGVVVVADGASANVVSLNGATITRLYETGPVPVALPLPDDRGATAGNAYRSGFAGTSLYAADLPPGIRIGLHRQQSVDYIAVLAGQVDLVLPDGRRTLKAGDILVQAATLHGWENPYSEPARILVVVITATAPTAARP